MKVYCEKFEQADAYNVNTSAALKAYYQMGFEIEITADVNEIDDADVVIGSVQFIHNALRFLGVEVPKPLDYPEELTPFLGRKIWESNIQSISNDEQQWNVFIKPKNITKKFTGKLIQNLSDLRGFGSPDANIPVWVSEPVHFLAEWRTFVRYGRIVGVHIYKGDWRCHFDSKIIENAVAAYRQAPNAYALDFGVTADGRTLLVEANDGYALGSYGLFYVDYAKLLSARWSQLVGRKDICDF